MSYINYPTVQVDSKDKVFVSFYINNKRYRLYNSNRIGGDFNPNSFPDDKRIEMGNVLAYKIYEHINNGGNLTAFKSSNLICGQLKDIEYITKAYKNKLKENYSFKYKWMFRWVYNMVENHLNHSPNSIYNIELILDDYKSETSYNTVKRHLNVLLNDAVKLGLKRNPIKDVRNKREKIKLHTPIKDISLLTDEIKEFNFNLYLCCLMTYGCLLRPHREIRELTWGDFSDDLSYIKLDGNRNKSGKNRIVPIPGYIRMYLQPEASNLSIFTGNLRAPNKDYFKTLWTRFKVTSKHLKKGQTLYSFRHSGAIEIFKRTGSITKLQKAMGHSSINVSLTYLRGLEIPELKEEDMPLL
jgi:integrase